MLPLIILGILLFLDSFPFFGLFVPGSACLLLGGGLVAAGFIGPYEAWTSAFLGTVAGTWLGFALGRKGDRIIECCPWLSKPLSGIGDHIASLGKWGFLALRFSPWGCVYPFWSGFSGVTFLRFGIKALTLHGLTTGLSLAAGYYLANGLVLAAEWMTRFGFLTLFFVAFAGLLFLAKWFLVKAGPAFSLLREMAASLGRSVAERPTFRRFIQSHQRECGFLHSRLKLDRFSGLPMTLLGICFVYSLAFFLGIIQDLVFHDPLFALDSRLADLLAAFRDPTLLAFFRKVTLLANWQILLSGGLLLVFLLLLWDRRPYVVPFLAALSGCGLTTSLLKNIFRRPRPFEMSAILKYSFPSGHSAFAACFYGFVFYIFAREFFRGGRKVDAFFSWLLLLSLVMFSRLYLGVHYLSDTLAGASLGILWLLVGISLTEWNRFHRQLILFSHPNLSSLSKRTLTLLPVTLFCFSTAFFLLTGSPPYAWQEPAREEKVWPGTVQELLRSKNLPRQTESILGNLTEPLSLVILASDRESLERAFRNAGWTVPDPPKAQHLFQALADSVENRSNPTAPMTPSFWNGRVNDLAFEKPTDLNTVRERHHARFWESGYITQEKMKIFLGTASLDQGIKWQRLVHHIDPDLDRERDFLVRDLTGTGAANLSERLYLVDPAWGKNVAGDLFFTDGQIVVLSMGITTHR